MPSHIGKLALTVFIGAASAAFGWLLHVLCGAPSSMPVGLVLPREYFDQASSFSEIDNARATLRAECARFLTELRSRVTPAIAAARVRGRNDPSAVTRKRESFAAAIREIDHQLGALQDSELELRLFREKLFLLNGGGWRQEWLNFYLKILYERPTHQVISEFADRALALGKAVGREKEVLMAFGHVARIPYDLPVKRTLAASTAAAGEQNGVMLAP